MTGIAIPARPERAGRGDREAAAPARIGAGLRRAVSVAVMVVLLVFILGPLVWLLLVAFSGTWVYPAFLPSRWTLSWWSQVFSVPGLGRSIVLSFVFAPVVTACSALICLPAAYAFARYVFPGRRVLLVSLFATNAFPKIGLYVTIAGLFYGLHLMGSFVGVVIIQLLGTVVFMTWIPTAAFASVPRTLEDAARDLGASPFRVFRQITLPLAAPGILVAVVLSFLASFDESQGTFLVGVPSYITMPIRMYSMVTSYPHQASAVFAIVLSVPSVLLILATRKWIMGGALAAGFQLR